MPRADLPGRRGLPGTIIAWIEARRSALASRSPEREGVLDAHRPQGEPPGQRLNRGWSSFCCGWLGRGACTRLGNVNVKQGRCSVWPCVAQKRRWDLPALDPGKVPLSITIQLRRGIPNEGQAREPTHGGFAGPDCGDSAPCSPLAGFRVRVSVFSDAWRTQTLDRLLGPGNRHNVLWSASARLLGQ